MAAAVVATGYGGPEVLAVTEIPTPDPGPGEMRIAVRAAGVNPIDAKSYSGAFGSDPAALPLRLGSEASGVVTAVGAGARGPVGPISVGEEIIAYRGAGAYASELVVPGDAVVPKPAAMSWDQAAGLMLTGATAVHLLTVIEVAAGDTVLINGAAGGVGLMAVQLAKARGARVIATASPSSHDRLRELGAEPVAYGEGLLDRVRVLTGGKVDVALDLVGSDEALDTSIELVADRDRIASIAAFVRGPKLGIKVLGNGPGADPGTEIRRAARLELVRLVDEGALQVFVGHTFALADAAEAHRLALGGRSGGGKIILLA